MAVRQSILNAGGEGDSSAPDGIIRWRVSCTKRTVPRVYRPKRPNRPRGGVSEKQIQRMNISNC